MKHLAVVVAPAAFNNGHVIDPLVAARVKNLRDSKGWTQAELAKAAGVATNTVGGLEAGRQTRFDKFKLVAVALGVTTQALQTGEGLVEENALIKKLRLSDEAVHVGKRFQNADTAIRLIVLRLLKVGERDPMLTLWERIERLTPHRRETVMLHIAEQEKAQRADEEHAKAGTSGPRKL